MSANQIPHFGPRSSVSDRREHSCPTCWKNGGPGHTHAEIKRINARLSVLPSWAPALMKAAV